MTAVRAFAASIACAVVAVVAVGWSSAGSVAPVVAAIGVVVAVVGVVVGAPAAVVAGAIGLVAGHAAAAATAPAGSVGGATVVVAVGGWLHVELALRSIELRPAIRPTAGALIGWLGTTAAVVVGTVVAWLLVGWVASDPPSGGLTVRLLSIAAVMGAAAVVVVPGLRLWSRTAGGRARG